METGERSSAAGARYAVALTAAAGLGITVVITAAGWDPAYHNRALHVAKETLGALVLLLLVVVLGGRFLRRGSLVDLLALAGILVQGIKNVVFSGVAAIVSEGSGGLTTWRTTGAGAVVAALLFVAALTPRTVIVQRRRALALAVAGSFLAFVVLSGIAGLFGFPGVLTDVPDTQQELELRGPHSALVVADALAAALLFAAGAAFARRAERERDEFLLWLGVGATIAGVAYLNQALLTSPFTDYFYAGELFRLAALAAWGVGTVREIVRYQAVYAPAAVLEDRRRVARDLHDGVAQELAFIASRMPRLEREGGDPRMAADVARAVQRALEESRAAISTLNRPLQEPLYVALATAAREVAAQAGARVEFDLDQHVAVPPAWEEALPRILREAVGNAVQHGRANTVKVHLHDGDAISMRVADDGIGFDPGQPGREPGFGIIGMRERAESLGGELHVRSEPGQGTVVEVSLP